MTAHAARAFLQDVVELLLEVGRHGAQFGRGAAKSAQHVGQILRSDDHDHDDRDHQQFAPTDFEHGYLFQQVQAAQKCGAVLG